MVSKKTAVKLTANFEANLASIEAFWIETDALQSYDRLLTTLLETVIPNLEQFPKIGRPFLSRQAQSVESQVVVERLKTRIGRSEIREYLVDDYLILYALIGEAVYLLSVKHHKQLSFDLEGFWPKLSVQRWVVVRDLQLAVLTFGLQRGPLWTQLDQFRS